MLNGKFLRLFSRLTISERTAFRKYLRSRHANEQIALEVYEYIHRHVRDATGPAKLEVDFANRRIFGARPDFDPANRSRLLNALSDLFLWLREFLLLETLKADTVEMQFMWLAILHGRELDAEYEREITRMLQQQRQGRKGGVTGYLREVAIGYMYDFQSNRAKQPGDVDVMNENMKVLDVYYAIARMKMMCEIATSKKVYQQPGAPAAHEPVLELVRQTGATIPLLWLYYQLYLLLTEHPEANYSLAESLLLEHSSSIDKEELLVIIPCLRNYITGKLAAGQYSWQHLHTLNRLGFESGIFDSPAAMPVSIFNGIVNTACIVKEFDWLRHFIAVQQKYLPASKRGDIVRLAEATIAFEKMEFTVVQTLLSQISLKDLSSRLRIKSMKLCCQYELEDDAADLLDRCNGFRAGLRRSKSPKKALLLRSRNFVQILGYLIEKKASRKAILRRIEETKELNLRTWLTRKAMEYRRFDG